MRYLRLLILALLLAAAIATGAVFVVAIGALIGAALLVRAIVGRLSGASARRRAHPVASGSDVIDVVATEVPTPKE